MVVVCLVVLVPIVSVRAALISADQLTSIAVPKESPRTERQNQCASLPSVHTIEIAWLARPVFIVPPVRLVNVDSTVERLFVRTHALGRLTLEHQVSLQREGIPHTNKSSVWRVSLVNEVSNLDH